MAKALKPEVILVCFVLLIAGCSRFAPPEQKIDSHSSEGFRLEIKDKGITFYTDKFDTRLYKRLGPFTAKPNALFVAGDDVPMPLFLKRDYHNENVIKKIRASDPELMDFAGLSSFNTNVEAEAGRLEQFGQGDFYNIDKLVSTYFPKNLKGTAIAEIATGSGYYCHKWTQLVGPKGKVFMVDLSPFSVGFMEYKFSTEDKIYHDKNQIVIIRNVGYDPCLPKQQKIKLVYIQFMHAYVIRVPHGYGPLETEEKCAHFWKAVEDALRYDAQDPAKLIVIDSYPARLNPGEVFAPEYALKRILGYTALKLEARFPYQGVGGGWVAVFAKTQK